MYLCKEARCTSESVRDGVLAGDCTHHVRRSPETILSVSYLVPRASRTRVRERMRMEKRGRGIEDIVFEGIMRHQNTFFVT